MYKKDQQLRRSGVEVFNGDAGLSLANINKNILDKLPLSILAKLVFGWKLIEWHHCHEKEDVWIVRDIRGFSWVCL